MVNAQDWLESQIEYNTKEKRKQITKLHIGQKHLEGVLNLNDFINLKEFRCGGNKITSLDLTNCRKLERINCDDDQLTNLFLPRDGSNLTWLICSNNYLTELNLSILNPKRLKWLDIRNNNFSESNLSIFASFTNLEILEIGNYDEKKINQNIYNRFYGSLEFLKGLSKLRWLNIDNTDSNKVDIEKLPKSLKSIYYSTKKRPKCKLTEIVPLLDLFINKNLQKEWKNQKFTLKQAQTWINTGLKPTDYDFCAWLRDELKLTPIEFLNDSSKMEDLREQFSEYQQFQTHQEIPPKNN